ncbi:peptide chain release factor N(5)-glutamine methyltransferase [Leptothoe sp. PORK10 BA2]|uniref:peptide chain release factor N(5)-glutamine methyltransferase n=1 Tax=Leptothoe sp. PORK10 BA2 TaxID=3110254 RepID=UPI002B221466|nr:peptide chain release factor N(5)-glutamine methyltransferase [Leptothoe sp. PORK10 BA2]MEA5463291.1 peptide chain release factor N(5)-glutamine methyltransferase [Leptothoe sp. PORK10 BA2]
MSFEALSVLGERLHQWILQARTDAQNAHVPLYELDWFVQGVSDLSQTDLSLELYRGRGAVPLSHSLDWLTQQWQRRLTERVPVQYLVGETPWRDLMLTVTPDVLIPRPETELMVDIVQAWAEGQGERFSSQVWADLGTGSGAIAIALAKAFPHAQILAIDISAAALEIAYQNSHRNKINNIKFYQGSWFEPISDWQSNLSGIITNPPYIPSTTVLNLDPEVAQHEPHQSLDGGDDGLNDIRHLIAQAPKFLKPGGLWLTEHMEGQSEAIRDLLAQNHGYQTIQPHQDLAGIDRFVAARFQPGFS